MYPSDYGYATDLSICTYNLYLYSSDSCYKNNWLYRGYFEWLITASDDTIEEGLFGGVAFYLAGGHVSCQDEGGAELFTSMSKNIRPVLYLKSDIAITGGSGTIDDMYTLG
jgi:hypothetical protein